MQTTAHPETSLAAYHSVSTEMQAIHFTKILKGLQKIKTGTYEEIAAAMKMEKNQVSRRLKEMLEKNLVVKTESKRPTRSGRAAYVYRPNEAASLPLNTGSDANHCSEITQPKNGLILTQGSLL